MADPGISKRGVCPRKDGGGAKYPKNIGYFGSQILSTTDTGWYIWGQNGEGA